MLQSLSIYKNLDILKQSDFQLKQNFKHKMIHPYEQYIQKISIDKMDKIEVTLELCTIFKGIPCGPAIIVFSHPYNEIFSFKGIGIFDEQGQLHNAPFICISGDGYGHFFDQLINGRPDDTFSTFFLPDGFEQNLDSFDNKNDVSGWQCWSTQKDLQNRPHGHGKRWFDDGAIYIGQYENGDATYGQYYELQIDGTHTLYDYSDGEGKESS